MPRQRSRYPKYRFHVSGQAVVTFCGKDFYLGLHDTPESHAKYQALCNEYIANGCKEPPGKPTHQRKLPITVETLTAKFLATGMEELMPSGNHHGEYRALCKRWVAAYGDTAIADFGPRKLRSFRDSLIADPKGNCRDYINLQVWMLKRIVKWGVAEELCRTDHLAALESMESLKIGTVHDNEPRLPVNIETVKRTLDHVHPVVADMLRLQALTGCRPSELFTLTPSEVDRSNDDQWFIRKRKHKTAHKGKRSAIPLGAYAASILAPYLRTDADKPCFLNTRGNPWNKDTYRRAVARACEREGIEHWTPYQIRHHAGQTVRDRHDAEHAQAILNHSRVQQTETYAKAGEQRAVVAAKELEASFVA